MRLNKSNTSIKLKKDLDWNSPLSELMGKTSPETSAKLASANFKTIKDLLWIFPLRVLELPPLKSFDLMAPDQLFIGRAKILNISARPNFGRQKGKKGPLLYTIVVHVKDLLSENFLVLRWFNAYGSLVQKIKKLDSIEFFGTPQLFQSQFQIVNPEIHEIENILSDSVFTKLSNELKIQYPTTNTLSSVQIKKVIDKIPPKLWQTQLEEPLPEKMIQKYDLITPLQAFSHLHGKVKPNKHLVQKIEFRFIYEEFFIDQFKLLLRRQYFKRPEAMKFPIKKEQFTSLLALFPHPFTCDQMNVVKEIYADLNSGHPMMRLVQGDVGCGKTWVAFMSVLLITSHQGQVAMMCPTESLALQHFQEALSLFSQHINVELLLGSTPSKEKKRIQDELFSGKINLIIGTHSLFQEKVKFQNLELAIIDEQHKFGVLQRLKLTNKGKGTHALIMSATPIPRSLSLTHYGDLDISTIKTMPSGRKGHKTKIITEETYAQFLNFFKTRLSLNEQAYVVVPAINESAETELHDLNSMLIRYKKYFPEIKIAGLHGELKAEEKARIFLDFKLHQIDILISTSVVEVGINVPNATIMAIMNPERFGLSSLHQLRGRVGRGEKPGFCFLVNDKEISKASTERLKVIENNTDGFKIAEEDLRLRGEGHLFGVEQSGAEGHHRFANIITHADILEKAKEDAFEAFSNPDQKTLLLLQSLAKDDKIFTTI